MNKKEMMLLSLFLKECKEEFSNHGCNDVPDEFYSGWSDEEIKEFNHKLNLYNGISDKNDDQYVNDAYYYDWWVLGYFAEECKKKAV